MKEIICDVEEFKNAMDPAMPLHHTATGRFVDKYGILYDITFKISGVAKDQKHVVIFQKIKRIDIYDIPGKTLNEAIKDEYKKLVEQYARPLGSTEGMWKP